MPYPFWPLLGLGTLVVIVTMALLFALSLRHRNFSYVDIGWSANFTVLALLYGLLGPGDPVRRALIATLFSLWSLRLTLHLTRRIAGQPEEGRYVELRRRWGASGNLNLRFFVFFEFQALLDAFLALPLLIACLNPAPGIHPLEWAGLCVFATGLLGESRADAELAAFKRNPANRGAVCDVGLWRYSRHPNYFFEWLIWAGYALFALASPRGLLALAMPALMLHFLLNVTGVRPTEAQALRSKGDRYREYQARTSAFFPWFPR